MRNIPIGVLVLLYTTILIDIGTTYDTPSNPQYHIQTDEGPERYFRYQTLSGQYRKEKRLEDGTVIGSYAWIDDDGILRQRDYVADNLGYRITKSKNVFVGRNIPVGDAVKAAKKYPSSAGTLVPTNSIPYRVTTPQPPSSVSSTVTPCASCIISPTTYKPDVSYFGSTPNIGPHVEISHNALPSSTVLSLVNPTEKPLVEITPGGFQVSTPTPEVETSTGLPLEYLKNAQAINNLQYEQTTQRPSYTETDQNSVEYNPYVNPLGQNVFFQNGPTYPIDKQGHTYRGTKKYAQARIGTGYHKQFPEYDGVSVTNDGFRYYIPRAYHEEETSAGNEKTGSFGYIDPFGIRRVIYYNAKPGEGFQHRKNNRYVGFRATPYDPNPY